MTFEEAGARLLELAFGWLPQLSPDEILGMDIGMLVFAIEAKVRHRAGELGQDVERSTPPVREDGSLDRDAVAAKLLSVLGGKRKGGRR